MSSAQLYIIEDLDGYHLAKSGAGDKECGRVCKGEDRESFRRWSSDYVGLLQKRFKVLGTVSLQCDAI